MAPDRTRFPRRAAPRVALAAALAGLLLACGCSRRGSAPGEFPPVLLGMTRAEVREALSRAKAHFVEEAPQMLRVVGRDPRVTEEVFLFYDERLAVWTMRFVEPASRASFARARRRLVLSLGEPAAERDDGLVVSARWRAPRQGGRVLLSGYVGGRGGHAPLMVRVEDPSVVRGLIRQLRREGKPPDPS